MEGNVCAFRDVKPTPDIIHTYSDTLKNAVTPIIIDNGLLIMLYCQYLDLCHCLLQLQDLTVAVLVGHQMPILSLFFVTSWPNFAKRKGNQ